MSANNLQDTVAAEPVAPDDDAVERLVAAQRVGLLYGQALAGNVVSVLNAALLALVMWSAAPHDRIVLWGIAVAAVTVFRVSLILAWRRARPAPEAVCPWRDAIVVASFLGGTLWGVAGALLFPSESPAHQMFLGFVLGGMMAGAVPYLSAVRGAYSAFALASAAPFAARLFTTGGLMAEVMGILVVFYTAMLLLTSHRMHQTITESLRLRYDKRRLTQSLGHVSAQLDSEISVREQAERAAGESERRARVLADAPFEGIVVHESGTVRDVNKTLLDMLGMRAAQVLGRRILEFVSPEARAAMQQELDHPTGLPFETVALCAGGGTLPVEARGRDIPCDGRIVRVVSIRDVSERKATEARLQQLVNYDPLTGLANRHLFREHFEQAIARARRTGHFVAILCLDLDNFRIINDTLGHAVGDQLLGQVAERLKGAIRGDDTVARLGGDEFALLVNAPAGADDALVVAQRVLAAITQRYAVDGHELFGAASIGIALFPLDGSDPDGLLRNAEVAMGRAKEKGNNHYEFFAREMNEQSVRRFELETSLRRALENGEFVLHYQPKVALDTGAVLGVEALIRWRHPDKGMIPPLDFIPLAEKTGLIVPIGEWVLESACGMMQRRAQRGLAPLPVAVNVSLRQLKQKDIVARIDAILARHGVQPGQLELEITEGTLADDIGHAVSLLNALHELRVPLSIDDFGIGYSSLNYLKQFPVSFLKVDRSFTRNVPDDDGDAAIVTAVAALAGSLGLKVVAEGVETPAQLAFLLDKGYYAAQGYLMSRPLAEEDLVEWMDLWQRTLDRDGRHPLFAGTTRAVSGGPRTLNS